MTLKLVLNGKIQNLTRVLAKMFIISRMPCVGIYVQITPRQLQALERYEGKGSIQICIITPYLQQYPGLPVADPFLYSSCCCIKAKGHPLHSHGGQNGKTSLNSTSRQNQDKVLDSEDQSHRSALPPSRTDPILCTLKQTFPGLSCHFRTKTIPPAYAFLSALPSPSVTNHQRTAQEPPGREFAC